MNKKFIFRLIGIIILILVLCIVISILLFYLNKEGFFKINSLIYGPGETGYGYGYVPPGYGYYGYGYGEEEDPCFHEPGTPDPCGGS